METLSDIVNKMKVPVILDPIFETSSGYVVHTMNEFNYFKKFLLPLTTVLTPNILEAEKLLNCKVQSKIEIERAANRLLDLGVAQIVIKGGHFHDTQNVDDYWTNGKESLWISTPKISNKSVRGTGCAFATALAANIAKGKSIPMALAETKNLLHEGIKNSVVIEEHHHVLAFSKSSRTFPLCHPIGFYPIVDNLNMLQTLIAYGVKTIQLRVKECHLLEEMLKMACNIAKQSRVQLFINDHWQLALKFGAYGIHLGQEDLPAADLTRIADANLRLGISVHSVDEAISVDALKPSYIAVGPIFQSATKPHLLPLCPMQMQRIQQVIGCPVVAIGGITLANLDEVIAMGVNGVAVIRALQSVDFDNEIEQWLLKCGS